MICNACDAEYATHVAYCTVCGYPFDADAKTKSAFVAAYLLKKSGKDEAGTNMRKASNALFGAAVLYLVSGVVGSFQEAEALWVGVALGVVFSGLAIWARHQALPAIISGIALFVLLILVMAVLEPITIFSGILWKVLILVFLIRGLKSARDARAEEVGMG